MNYSLLDEAIKNLDDKTLIEICNEIEDYNNTITLKEDGEFLKLYNEHKDDNLNTIDMLKSIILFEAHRRYRKLVKLLL